MARDLKPCWVHPSQFPPAVTDRLRTVTDRLRTEDQRLEADVLAALRTSRLPARVAPMVEALTSQDNPLSKRSAFQVVSVVLGLSPGHVTRLYYESRGVTCSK